MHHVSSYDFDLYQIFGNIFSRPSLDLKNDLDETIRKWKAKRKKPDGEEDHSILRGRRGRPKGSPDKSTLKRWERCEPLMIKQIEFVACLAWLLKVCEFTFYIYSKIF